MGKIASVREQDAGRKIAGKFVPVYFNSVQIGDEGSDPTAVYSGREIPFARALRTQATIYSGGMQASSWRSSVSWERGRSLTD